VLSGDPVYGPKAAYWSSRTFDISSFLLDKVNFRQPLGRVEAVVTYHDSCHLKKSMHVSREPREILKSIPGITFKEMSAPDACCGSGGSFVLTHFETSTKIAGKKVEDVNRTGAGTVATGCPACMMQLLDNLQRFGSGQDVEHYVSLLARSYRNEAKAQ
jgi:glycolate oxidase iron-sulfur subunit